MILKRCQDIDFQTYISMHKKQIMRERGKGIYDITFTYEKSRQAVNEDRVKRGGRRKEGTLMYITNSPNFGRLPIFI